MSSTHSYAVFGLGRYGYAVAKELVAGGADVLAVDADEASAGQPPAYLERMARAAERTVQINAVRADIQKLDGLVQENGFM